MFDWNFFKKCVTETKKIVCQNVHQKVFPFKTSFSLSLSPSLTLPFFAINRKVFSTSQVNSVKYQKSLTRWENSIFHTTTSNFGVYK